MAAKKVSFDRYAAFKALIIGRMHVKYGGGGQDALAADMRMSESTLRRRLSAPETFTLEEVRLMAIILGFDFAEAEYALKTIIGGEKT